VNVDQEESLAKRYEITSIPTIMVFEDSILVKKIIGAHPKHKLVKEFDEWI
jgi:thioredoxin 1